MRLAVLSLPVSWHRRAFPSIRSPQPPPLTGWTSNFSVLESEHSYLGQYLCHSKSTDTQNSLAMQTIFRIL